MSRNGAIKETSWTIGAVAAVATCLGGGLWARSIEAERSEARNERIALLKQDSEFREQIANLRGGLDFARGVIAGGVTKASATGDALLAKLDKIETMLDRLALRPTADGERILEVAWRTIETEITPRAGGRPKRVHDGTP